MAMAKIVATMESLIFSADAIPANYTLVSLYAQQRLG